MNSRTACGGEQHERKQSSEEQAKLTQGGIAETGDTHLGWYPRLTEPQREHSVKNGSPESKNELEAKLKTAVRKSICKTERLRAMTISKSMKVKCSQVVVGRHDVSTKHVVYACEVSSVE
jgi:hypothetical protein